MGETTGARGTAEERIRLLEKQLVDKETMITELQARGTKIIDDQRDLKRLVKTALVMLADDVGVISGEWVLRAQATIERMK